MTEQPNLLARKICAYFDEKAAKPLSPDTISEALHANNEAVLDALEELEQEGRLFANKAGRYGLPRMMGLVVGRLKGNERGFGFIIPDEEGQTDAFVGRGNFGTAIHGDRVVGRVLGDTRGQGIEAKIIRVLARARETIVGTFRIRGDVAFVAPLDRRIHVAVIVAHKDWFGAQHGEVVVAQVLDWEAPREIPVGKVIEVLGDPDDPGVDILAIVRKFELPDEFPPEVEAEAEKCDPAIADEEWTWRKNLSDEYIITIDPVDAKDFDDAISLEEKDGGWRLGVHIADVSNYVVPGTELDEEAFLRGNSVYLPDRVLPMLPERLSNFVCSLRPGELKRTVSVIADLDARGEVTAVEATPSAINSRYRLWYELAQDLIDGKKSPDVQELGHGRSQAELDELADRLRRMDALAKVLYKRRLDRGAIDLDQPEAKIILDEASGKPLEIRVKERLRTHQLIEEFMLLANEAVAKLLTDAKGPALYRIHDKPDPRSLQHLSKSLKFLQMDFSGDELADPRAMQRLIKAAEGKPLERLIKFMLLRSLQRAVYSPKNVGHFGLASGCYTHFTSPIRRYPDLVVHRLLKALHAGDGSPYDRTELSGIAKHTSATEELAEEAEREADEFKKLEYLTGHLGEVFAGTITGVIAKGVFVELNDLLIEGLVHVAKLGDDYYSFQESPDQLVGRNTGNTYRLGDKLQVQVVKVDLAALRLDLDPAGKIPEKKADRGRRRPPAEGEPHWLKYLPPKQRSRASRRKKYKK
ncbi:MAG TPA: ribonuclease R [bacterium]|nr:ribonuclease R [bacterium]